MFALFEESQTVNFFPITLTRPTFDVKLGCFSTFEMYENNLNFFPGPDFLLTRDYLSDITRQRHEKCSVNPEILDSGTIFVNGMLANPKEYEEYISKNNFVITGDNSILMAKLRRQDVEYFIECIYKGIKVDIKKLHVDNLFRIDLTAPLGHSNHDPPRFYQWPWQIVNFIETTLTDQINRIESEEMPPNRPVGVRIAGNKKVIIERETEVEEGTVIDARDGPVFIGKRSKISPCRITGPAAIGRDTHVKQYSLISKSSIGNNCRIAGEIELSIISDYTNKAHDGFFGHSYAGEWINIGANTTTSDLKMSYGNIKMDTYHDYNTMSKVNTFLNKIGSFYGDMSKTSIGTCIFGGVNIGVSSHLFGVIKESVPSFTISAKGIGSNDYELRIESAVETQRRMMQRRGIEMSQVYEKLITDLFAKTSELRDTKGVSKEKFAL